MKNKKLLTRLFALLASLVLVLALALPCFADTVESEPKIVKTVSFTDLDELFAWVELNKDNIFMVRYEGIVLTQINYYDYGPILELKGTIVFTLSSGSQLFESQWHNYRLDGRDYSITDQYMYFTVNSEGSNYSFSTSYPSYEDLYKFVFYYYDVAELGGSVETEGGWYGEIKNIIKDAVFGQDAVLNDSQEFTLNQISLWLSLIAILLPLIVVAVIVVRCFR